MEDVILHGDTYACLKQLEDDYVAVAITSPPYWMQRDYGFEGQIGQEQSSEEYIGHLVAVYDRLRRKLRKDGVFFLNVGDKYLGQYGKSHLLQIPYRLAYHMVEAGWHLVDIIIWYKPNHMPSSVRDRFANTYEPILVLARNRKNIYGKGLNNVVKISLQQTPWKHTAAFPERLVEEMLNRTLLDDGDVILDPFAGTGTVAAVVQNMRSGLFPKNIYSVMIEKGDEFVKIIQDRTHIEHVKDVDPVQYSWNPVVEKQVPELGLLERLEDRHGEVFIAQNSSEFLSVLRGVASERFKRFHRVDALYFFGVKDWALENLYYISQIFKEGYVLRNMLVVDENSRWYPIFMFASDSTVVAYKFYLDRVRTRPKTEELRYWSKEDFVGMKVADASGKKPKEGWIVKVLEKYEDCFPRLILVGWDGHASLEMVLNPKNDELMSEGLNFKCPACGQKLVEPFDPSGENLCPSCKTRLFDDIGTLPLIEEPGEIALLNEELKRRDYVAGEVLKVEQFRRGRSTSSKFVGLERVNWGASPGARKMMVGEYFSKMRLYRLDQPTAAQYLTVLRKAKGLSMQDVVNRFSEDYRHTVGHWFRKDFGGSLPIADDVKLLEKILDSDNRFLEVLERTALKFQTVKASVKGKNPGDFLEDFGEKEVVSYLKMLLVPSQQYIAFRN